MMYDSYAFSGNGLPTITKTNGNTFTTQRDTLSEDDIFGVRYMYTQWAQISGGAKTICIGADGSTYVLGTDDNSGNHSIFKLVNGSWVNIPGWATAIAVAPDGTPWVVNSLGNIFKRVSGSWSQLSGGARDISIGVDGTVYILGTDNNSGNHSIFKLVNGSWVNVPGWAISIAVGPGGAPWVVNSDGNIFRRDGSSWTQLPGSATSISVGADGSIYITGTDNSSGSHGLFKWINGVWRRMGGWGVRITGDLNGMAWVTNSNNEIFQLTKF
jgi:hypothetical protein